LGVKAQVGLLGGALAAGTLALGIYFSGGEVETAGAQDVTYFRIGAGTPGSAFYGMAGQIAGIISNPPGSRNCDGDGACGVEGLLGLAQTTANPVAGIEALRKGTLEAGIVSGDIADAALHGTGPFKDAGAMKDLRAVANIGTTVLHIVVAKNSEITEVKALAGKRVAIGPENSGNALSARILLRAAGLPDKKTKFIAEEIASAAAQLLTGEIQALAIVEQMPDADVGRLLGTGNYRLLGAEPVAKDTPNYIFGEWITAAQYPGAESVRALAVPTVLVVRSDLPGQIADGLVRTLWFSANPDAAPSAAGSLKPDMSRASIAWHPNAATAYAELAKVEPAMPETAAPTN
jgi:TRAP transporter TAXI family solute receptor